MVDGGGPNGCPCWWSLEEGDQLSFPDGKRPASFGCPPGCSTFSCCVTLCFGRVTDWIVQNKTPDTVLQTVICHLCLLQGLCLSYCSSQGLLHSVS